MSNPHIVTERQTYEESDYLDQIQRARSPMKLAMLIRAFTCQIVGGTYYIERPGEAQRIASAGEHCAQTIERFEAYTPKIRELLGDWGYLYKRRN